MSRADTTPSISVTSSLRVDILSSGNLAGDISPRFGWPKMTSQFLLLNNIL